MSNLCLLSTSVAGKVIESGCIQDYVLYGIILFIIGILMASFIPLPSGKKLGLGITILGLVMSVGFPLIKKAWNNSIGFQMVVYGGLAFVIIMIILFPKTKIPDKLNPIKK